MKRLHTHVTVDQLEESGCFHCALFGHPLTVAHTGNPKGVIEDLSINFAISKHGRRPDVNHVDFQVETLEEFAGLLVRIDTASDVSTEQKHITSRYARLDKLWVPDPSSIAWENSRTLSKAVVDGDAERVEQEAASGVRVANAWCTLTSGMSSPLQQGGC